MFGAVNCWIGVAVDFYDTVQVFRSVIRTGTNSLKVNLIQNLTVIREEVLYKVLLDLQKTLTPWIGSIAWNYWGDKASYHEERGFSVSTETAY